MNEREAYDTKRKNFVQRVPRLFRFLISEYGYSGPSYSKVEQENGFVISDRFEYRNDSIDRLIRIHNDYHPVDYGFEIEIYRPSMPDQQEDKLLVHHVLKEDQDTDQEYLSTAAGVLLERHQNLIAGRDWPNSI